MTEQRYFSDYSDPPDQDEIGDIKYARRKDDALDYEAEQERKKEYGHG